MSEKRHFHHIYAKVPDAQRDELARFRADFLPYFATADDIEWEYVDTAPGDMSRPAVLLLVGGLRMADAAFRNIPMLADEFRIITPNYPTLGTMAALADGLVGILDAAGVQKAHVLAGSYGGMLAQVFVRRHPERVDKLILSTTAVLDTQAAARYRQALEGLVQLPPEMVTEVAQQQMFTTIAPPEEEEEFWRAYVDELYSYRVSKDALISTYESMLDFAESYTFEPSDLDQWDGEMLILESDNDATFNEEARAAVRALYPRAKTHVFVGAGHSPGTTQRDTYFRVVKDFLRSNSS